MTLQNIHRFITLHDADCRYRFFPAGDVYDFVCGSAMANLFRGNARDGSLNNIYLRIYGEDSVTAHPLLGIASGSRVRYSNTALVQEGTVDGISYRVKFRPVKNIWFWDIQLDGNGQTVDLVYGQDIGVAGPGGIYSNDLYNSQYLGHCVFASDTGYAVCSRHNMGTRNHCYMQQGVLGANAIHYSTDGLQFFGLSAKVTGIPQALSGDLEDTVLQNEFAYTALQTERFCLNGTRELAFYGMLCMDHPEAVTELEYRDEIRQALEICRGDDAPLTDAAPVTRSGEFGDNLVSLPYSAEEINALFPEQTLPETADSQMLSFFTPEHAHVVTMEKERRVERPHGTIIITPPDTDKVNSALISSTHYIYGVFNSHVVVGNTDMHKFLSTPRNTLNLVRHTGQRLYVRLGSKYRMLTVPGLYEMGMNYSRWYYKTEEDTFVVTSFTTNQGCGVRMDVQALSGRAYDFIVTSHVTMGPDEHAHDIVCEPITDGLRFPLVTREYPDTFYEIRLPGCDFTLSDDRIYFDDQQAFDESHLTFRISEKSRFSVCTSGWLETPSDEEKQAFDAALAGASFEDEAGKAVRYYENLTRSFRLTIPGEPDSRAVRQTEILNHTIYWYAHNAMIHFATPHGMEQPSGAAWGTRDICQGPMEFFLATGNHALARDVLLRIFAHQEVVSQEWPQWFMFDRYTFNAGECHGDVIFWPLKALADYILASGDHAILEEKVSYLDAPDRQESLLSHVLLALENIRNTRLIGDTGLITYAGGDWDDTLQPASEELKKRLVSAWTEALAFQTFRVLSTALAPVAQDASRELAEMAEQTRQAFESYLIQDSAVAGFLMYGDQPRCMLHPSDEETGIHYRLLPMTRSIIAELVSPGQAAENVRLIHENLKCPDGVRLMDRPASYNGGPSKLFLRAEQAANVGREISLQYTHAHIRYIEAMAKLGNGQEAWDSLFVINPILIQESVPNAVIRQSNLYFSSSEGAYKDRYEYAEKFHLLASGSIPVKGGWRLYSSGPGIYTNQLIASVLGIRICAEGLVLDPSIPEQLDGLRFEYVCFGRRFTFVYHTGSETVRAMSGGTELAGSYTVNPYRRGGLVIGRELLNNCGDIIDIYC